MEKESLSDILEYARVGGKEISISLYDVTLIYDKNKFKENPKKYIEGQLEVHKKCLDAAKEELSGAYKELNDKLESEGDLERVMRFIPENAIRPIIELTKLIAAPSYLLEFKTLKSSLNKEIHDDETSVETYKSIREILGYGREFLEDRKIEYDETLSDNARSWLDECIHAIKEVYYRYTRLTETAEKIVEADKRFYALLFPEH